jgi:hypothetical protein
VHRKATDHGDKVTRPFRPLQSGEAVSGVGVLPALWACVISYLRTDTLGLRYLPCTLDCRIRCLLGRLYVPSQAGQADVITKPLQHRQRHEGSKGLQCRVFQIVKSTEMGWQSSAYTARQIESRPPQGGQGLVVNEINLLTVGTSNSRPAEQANCAHRRRPAYSPDDPAWRWLPHRGNLVHQESGRGVFRIDPQADREAGGPRYTLGKGMPWRHRCNQLQSFPKRAEGPKGLFSLTLQSESSCNRPPGLDLAYCRSDEGWKVSLHGRPYRRPASRDYATPQALLQKLPGLPGDPGAAHHPALRPTWQQTLLLGNAGTHQIHPWYKKGKDGISLSGCSCFFRGTSWWSTCLLAVDRLSSI